LEWWYTVCNRFRGRTKEKVSIRQDRNWLMEEGRKMNVLVDVYMGLESNSVVGHRQMPGI
jgi:hypothetical protein